MHVLLDVEDRLREPTGLLDVGLEDVVRDPLRGLGSYSRQAPELVEQALQILVARHCQRAR